MRWRSGSNKSCTGAGHRLGKYIKGASAEVLKADAAFRGWVFTEQVKNCRITAESCFTA